MADRKTPVVCYAGDNYFFSNPHSRFHLMHALHRRGHRVLWVNNIGMNMPRPGRSGFWRRVASRLRSWARWLRRAEPDFFVLSPIALPLFGVRWLERANDAWMSWQLRLATLLTGVRRPLVFASIPSFAGVIARLPRSSLIYYYSDKYAAYRDITAREAIEAYDRRLLADADSVFCAAERVYAELRDARPHVHYLPHAVDFRHFHAAVENQPPVPPDLARVPRPWIGYFGSLTDSNDQEMVRHAAVADPSLHFVLIGKVLGDFSGLAQLPNVHFLGFKPYAELPAYGVHLDVAFMAWKMTDWIRHSNPLKTKEYLSMGLPVVSVPILELERHYADVVELATTPAEFLDAVHRALVDGGEQRRRDRIAKVSGESWDARAAAMLSLHEEALADA